MENNSLYLKFMNILSKINWLDGSINILNYGNGYNCEFSILIIFLVKFFRNRTSTYKGMYFMYFYFINSNLLTIYKAFELFKDKQKSYYAVWNWFKLTLWFIADLYQA